MPSDTVFHRDNNNALEFNAPFARLVVDGNSDGSISAVADADDVACTLFNTVCWSYVHLRGRHGWPTGRARNAVTGLVLNGLLNPPT
jgi:hypothetical protein